jgi:hypothetical protein
MTSQLIMTQGCSPRRMSARITRLNREGLLADLLLAQCYQQTAKFVHPNVKRFHDPLTNRDERHIALP